MEVSASLEATSVLSLKSWKLPGRGHSTRKCWEPEITLLGLLVG
jgi:hypothetical protein